MLNLLEGIKVLDLTRLLPGPVCTWYLTELGAEVIKIEPPEGDYVRFIPPLAKKNSYLFLQLNYNKSLKTLDFKKNADLKFFLEMAKEADVVVESFRPGVTKNLGIDFETLKGINPSIVYCSITGYGQSGPYKDFPGHDLNYLAYSGILDQISSGEGKPMIPNFQIADLSGGALSSCIGILAALISARKNKTPHYLDVSMMDSVIALNHVALSTFQAKMRDIPGGKDILTGGFPFYAVYETKDKRFIALGALEFKFWKNFCEAVGKKDWTLWHEQPSENYPDYRKELENLFQSREMKEWDKMLKEKECCFSPVLKMSETMENEQVKARDIYQTNHSQEEGHFYILNFPIRNS